MKRLGKLEINPARKINNNDLLIIKGGYGDEWMYWCRCGFTPDYNGDCFPLVGVTLQQALTQAGESCYPHGATCQGVSNGCPN